MRRRTNLHESGSNSIAREKRKIDGSDITGAWGFKRDKRKRKKKETKQRKKKTHTWASNILTNSSVSSLCIKFLKRQEDCPPPSQLDTFPKSKPRRRAFLLVKTHWLLQWIALHEIHHSKISHPHVPSSCSCILLFIVGIPFLILYFTTTAAAQSDPAPRHLSIVSIAAHPIPYHHPPTPSPRTSFFPHGHPPPLFHPNPKPPETLPKDPPSSLNRQIRTSTTAQTLSHPQTNTTLRFAIRFRPHTPTNFINARSQTRNARDREIRHAIGFARLLTPSAGVRVWCEAARMQCRAPSLLAMICFDSRVCMCVVFAAGQSFWN